LKNSIKDKNFKNILFASKSLKIRDLLFYYKKDNRASISFIVNKSKGSAVLRNKFKRRCRSLFFNFYNHKLKNIQIIVRPTLNLENNFSWKELKLTFENFCSKL
tara:strand:+ start:2238 stop:2549 length:312 start_codon:yes stop_codon:yes gene_type:complete